MVRPLVPSKAGGETKQSSPSSLRCGGSFLAPHHRRSVVAARVACFARDRCDLAEDEMLQDGALQFKIRICQGAVRTGKGNHLVLNLLRVGFAPHNGTAVVQEPNSAAAGFGGIASTDVNVDARHQFLQLGRTALVAEEQVAEEVQLFLERGSEADAAVDGAHQCLLEKGKVAIGPTHPRLETPQNADERLPSLYRHPVVPQDIVQEGERLGQPLGRDS